MISGMVMKGPTPIMSIMFSAMALRRFSPRTSVRLFSWLMPRAQQVHIKSHCAWHAVWKLAEECVAGVDVSSFAELRTQHSALQRLLAGIVRRQQRLEVVVPTGHEIHSALLNPSVKIFLRNLVRIMEDRIFSGKNSHRRFFHAHALIAQRGGIGCVFSVIEIIH